MQVKYLVRVTGVASNPLNIPVTNIFDESINHADVIPDVVKITRTDGHLNPFFKINAYGCISETTVFKHHYSLRKRLLP